MTACERNSPIWCPDRLAAVSVNEYLDESWNRWEGRGSRGAAEEALLRILHDSEYVIITARKQQASIYCAAPVPSSPVPVHAPINVCTYVLDA